MKIEIKNTDNKAGMAMVEALGGKFVRGIAQGRRSDLKNTLGNLVVGGYAGCPRAEGYICLDASLATEKQADSIYLSNIMGRGKPIEVFLRWYVIFHTLTPKRVVARLVQTHNDMVPERYHLKAKLTEAGYIELHHSEPLLGGYIDGDPCHVGRTTHMTTIDPLHCYSGNDIPLHHIMDAYERLSPDWGGSHKYETYLHAYSARQLAGWPADYWYKDILTPENYKDLFNAYQADAIRRRLVRKFGKRVKPLTYRR